MVKIQSSVVAFAALSVVIFFGNELIIGFVDFQNYHFSTFFGGDYVFAETSQGKLRGFTSVSRDGQEFYEFLAVPFAQAPVGELRFEPPVEFPKWEGVRDALSYGHRCLQFDYILQMFTGDEDCLSLNVYTPSKKIVKPSSHELLPVVVFLFGGMFMFGRTEIYRPEYFVDAGAVLVTLNYRLGPLGFLSTGDEVVRGNMGLKDQLMAFKWIRDNIAAFGGDPNSVTLMGESAGGASVHYHMLSNASKDLFHRGISMSGSALNSWALMKKPKEQSIHFGKQLSCPTNCTKELVRCARAKSAHEIAVTFQEARDQLHDRLAAFAPTVEVIQDEQTFLREDPRVTISKGKIANNVPWILGVNDEEGLIYAGDILFNKTCSYWLVKSWFKHAPTLFHYEETSRKTRKEISKLLWNFYLKGQEPFRLHKTLPNLTAIFSDTMFYLPLRETVELQGNKTDMYLYYYNYPARHGLAQVSMMMTGLLPVVLDGLIGQIFRNIMYSFLGLQEKHWGACHTDELGVLFQLPAIINRIQPGSRDYEFSKTFVQSIVYFAKHGKPMSMNGHEWTRATPSNVKYMQLNSNPQMISEPFEQRVDFVKKTLSLARD